MGATLKNRDSETITPMSAAQVQNVLWNFKIRTHTRWPEAYADQKLDLGEENKHLRHWLTVMQLLLKVMSLKAAGDSWL